MPFTRACALADVRDDEALALEIDGLDVAVVRIGDEIYAIEDECSHAAVALSEGDVEMANGTPALECWMHGSRFDLRTGAPTGPPATEPVPVFPVRVEGDDVLINVGES